MAKDESDVASSSSSIQARRIMSNASFSMELFVGSDYFGMCQGDVLDALFQQGLDIAIEEEKPADMIENDWRTINRMACTTIRSCLSKEQKYGYKNETSTSKLWKALEEKFLKKSTQNRLYMKKRLFRFDYQPGTSMNEHIIAFNELVADLLGMDEAFKDEDLALMLLTSLPDEFEHLETTLLHGKDEVTLKEVISALYSYELRKKTKMERKYNATEAMVARGRLKSQKPKMRGRSKSKSRLGKDACAFCHEKGHWKKDCLKLKKKGKAAPDTCVAYHNTSDFEISLVASSSLFHSDEWILDSGCTYHMSPGREWFFDLVELNGGVVAAASEGDNLDSTLLWHMWLGHAGEKSLQILARQGFLKGAKACKLQFCEHCVLGKHKRVKFDKAIHCTKDILDYVHSDVWGPFKTSLLGGKHYFVTFVDNFSRRVWVYAMKFKDELSSAIEGKTPFEVWFRNPATGYDSLHVFGSTTYHHVKESKLDPRSKKAFFMGFTHGVKGFRLWCVDTKKIICSRVVTFDESAILKKVELQKTVISLEIDDTDSPPLMEESEDEEVQTQEPLETSEPLVVTRPRRKIRKPARFKDTMAYAFPVIDDDILGNWVFEKKDGSPSKKDVRYKARLVAKGYAQKEGIEYNEVFSPVVKHSSIRILLALVAQLNLELAQLDVKMAFLHSDWKRRSI
ncbi:hypothetical protein GQ457_14G001800 [Hibiscus cannabinus]